jgi:Lrp/AsnC family transcriptional regulator for asnA, asnC and gidA
LVKQKTKSRETKTKQIDEADAKILKTLLIESRTSFTELAKICNISVTAIIRRYNRLKKTGIIRGEHMYLNPLSVGYESIAEMGIITDLADKEKVEELLRAKPYVKIAPSLGRYSIYGLLLAQKLDELTEIVQLIDLKPYVKSLDVLIFADLWDNPWHPENLVVKPSERENLIARPKESKTKFERVSLDETDKRIAKMLMENSRTAFKEIAEKLGISTNNVIQRYQFLREKNVLNLSSISLNLFKLGYNAIADSYIKVENRGTMPEVEAQLLQIPNASFCAKFVGGAYDLRVAVIVADFADVFRLKKRIRAIKNIKTAEFYLAELPDYWPNDFVAGTLI